MQAQPPPMEEKILPQVCDEVEKRFPHANKYFGASNAHLNDRLIHPRILNSSSGLHSAH
jgi:hypothetical protein